MLAWSRVLSTAARRGLVGRIETQALLGEPVRVLSRRGSWARVAVVDQPSPKNPAGYPGWVPARQLTSSSSFGRLLTGPIAVVIVPRALMRSAGRSVELSVGSRLPMRGRSGGTVLVVTPAGGLAQLPRSAVAVYRSAGSIPPPTGAGLVATARSFLGVRYLWGGTSSYGFDCSGLVNMTYRARGVVIPRDAEAQALTGRPVTLRALRPGDLVFFATSPPSRAITHVAMYVGGGRTIEAPDSSGAVHVIPLATRAGEYVTARRYVPAA
jgi:cell wall-associated NlpC family hydrolase